MVEYKKQKTSDDWVNERLEESRVMRERARLMLDDVRDLAEAWCLCKPVDLEIRMKLDELREMIEESVKQSWGDGAYCEFEVEPKRRVIARHRDGRMLVVGKEAM